MGLDMYLTKEIYVGAQYKHNNVKAVIEIESSGQKVKVNPSKVKSVIEEAGSWRKANQIHKFFVDELQKGKDDCEKYYAPYEKLSELKLLCEKVLETKDHSLLPPEAGFFFGSTDADEWYFKQVQETIDIIEDLDPDGDYYYQASW